MIFYILFLPPTIGFQTVMTNWTELSIVFDFFTSFCVIIYLLILQSENEYFMDYVCKAFPKRLITL